MMVEIHETKGVQRRKAQRKRDQSCSAIRTPRDSHLDCNKHEPAEEWPLTSGKKARKTLAFFCYQQEQGWPPGPATPPDLVSAPDDAD